MTPTTNPARAPRRRLPASAVSAVLALCALSAASAFSPPPPHRAATAPARRPFAPPPLPAGNTPGGGLPDLFAAFRRPAPAPAPETPEEAAARERAERAAMLDAGEALREARVREDAIPYLVLLAIQFLPLAGDSRYFSGAYFIILACTTVYVGGRQYALEPGETIQESNALYAPVGASVALGLLYFLLKVGIDPTALYSLAASVFGVLAVGETFVPLLRAALPGGGFGEQKIAVPAAVGRGLGAWENDEELPADGVAALGLGLALLAVYWYPGIALTDKFLVSNVLAWSIGMASLAAIELSSFRTGAILLGGLFFYDIFFVFGTDVMMTVATKIEAPVKFLYYTVPSDGIPRDYPFSVLGLGDIVIPGLFVRMLSRVDEALQPEKVSYFDAGVLAYAVGLILCFVVNNVTGSGQPALLYLDPLIVGGALLTGAANGQLGDVWNYAAEGADDDVDDADGE